MNAVDQSITNPVVTVTTANTATPIPSLYDLEVAFRNSKIAMEGAEKLYKKAYDVSIGRGRTLGMKGKELVEDLQIKEMKYRDCINKYKSCLESYQKALEIEKKKVK
jgi:hypothetical protein